MQVHEISRKALDDLKKSGRLEDWTNGHGDYAIVCCLASFAHTPLVFDLQDYFDSEYWACQRAESRQNISLSFAANDLSINSCCHYYEVWHIVEDDDPIVCYCVVPYRMYEDRYHENIVEAPNGEFCFETEREAEHFAINLASMTYPDDKKQLLFSKVDVIKDVDHLETPLFTCICHSMAVKVVKF